jgi:hypothetical protein
MREILNAWNVDMAREISIAHVTKRMKRENVITLTELG